LFRLLSLSSFGHFGPHRADLLEVQSFEKSEELVFSEVQFVVDDAVCEKHRVVSKFDLLDCVGDADFEFHLSLDSVADAAAKLFNVWRVNEQEVAFNCLVVDVQRALHVHFKDRNHAIVLDALNFTVRRSIKGALKLFLLFDEFFLFNHLVEFSN